MKTENHIIATNDVVANSHRIRQHPTKKETQSKNANVFQPTKDRQFCAFRFSFLSIKHPTEAERDRQIPVFSSQRTQIKADFSV